MTAVHEPCLVKLVYHSAAGHSFPALWQRHSNAMKDQLTDPTKMAICPYVNRPVFKPDDVLMIRLKAVGADTIVLSSSTVRIPVTKRDIRTGAVYDDVLVEGDFAETDGGTDGLAFAAAEEGDFAKYTVPAGTEMKLGHKIAQNSRICVVPYDDTS